jgi:hypothetical protein
MSRLDCGVPHSLAALLSRIRVARPQSKALAETWGGATQTARPCESMHDGAEVLSSPRSRITGEDIS